MVTFKNLARRWFKEKQKVVKPSSATSYFTVLDSLIPYFQDKEVNRENVQGYIIYLTVNKKSYRTVRSHLSVLENILKFGSQNKICGTFNFDFDYPTVLKTRKRESASLTVTETRKLRKHLAQSARTNYYDLAILICLSCGLRVGECTALRFSDFDFKNKKIYINKTSQRIFVFDDRNTVVGTKINVGPAKTKSSVRTVPVSDDILEIVQGMKGPVDNDGYVFRSKKGDYPIDNRYLRQCFYKTLKELKLPFIVFHGLRHTFASNCIASDIDVKTTSSLLGHSDVKMTLNIYTHPSTEQQRNAINKLGKLYRSA